MKKLIAALLISTPLFSLADQVFLDDVIVDGSQCVGQDCANGHSFGFDTFVMKENNLRMLFDDSSSTGSFPSTDWRFTFNDSSNGGSDFFSIDDVTNTKVPFKIEAGAPSNALFVDATGDIGVGTSAPVVELHVTGGDSPTMRLEQDGSSGFTAQTWDVAGNETNFFVRDVTNGSDLPFRIMPGTGDDNLVLKGGKVGVMTASPTSTLHVQKSDGTASIFVQETSGDKSARNLLELENNGNPQILFTNTANGNSWAISAGLNLVIKNNANSTIFTVTPEGDIIFKKSDDVTNVSLQALIDHIESTDNVTISSTTP